MLWEKRNRTAFVKRGKNNKVKHNKVKHNKVKILSVGKKQKLNEIYHVIMTENSFEGAVQ